MNMRKIVWVLKLLCFFDMAMATIVFYLSIAPDSLELARVEGRTKKREMNNEWRELCKCNTSFMITSGTGQNPRHLYDSQAV
jgi:hypothetical protein